LLAEAEFEFEDANRMQRLIPTNWLTARSMPTYRYAVLAMLAALAAHAESAERQVRPWGNGWQVATEHFIVTCSLDRETALAAAEQLENAWNDTASLADRFTDAHHRDRFGAGAVGVLVGKPRQVRARQTAPHAFAASDVVMIRLELEVSSDGGFSEEQTKQLRDSASRAFLHLAEIDGKLPVWASDGLAQYVANRGRLPISDTGLALPTTISSRSLHTRHVRRASDDVPTHTTSDPNAGRWIAYLLNGDDAAHAPATLEAIRQTIERRDGSTTAIDHYLANTARNHDIAAWIEDPNVDQPIWEIPENQAEYVTNAQREMAIVLKLARRFKYAPYERPQVKIIAVTRENELVSHTAPELNQRPPSMREFYRKLAESGHWATSTSNGGVLYSDDHNQLRDLLGIGERRYTTAWRDGKLVLTRRLQDGTIIEGVLSDNLENPRRPLAEFEVR
jgi:hypothetical protein